VTPPPLYCTVYRPPSSPLPRLSFFFMRFSSETKWVWGAFLAARPPAPCFHRGHLSPSLSFKSCFVKAFARTSGDEVRRRFCPLPFWSPHFFIPRGRFPQTDFRQLPTRSFASSSRHPRLPTIRFKARHRCAVENCPPLFFGRPLFLFFVSIFFPPSNPLNLHLDGCLVP